MQPIIIEHAGAIRGKERPRATTRGGRATVYTSSKQSRAEATILASALKLNLPPPLTGPIKLQVQVRRKMPKSWPKKRRADLLGDWVDAKPDSDNVLKNISDAFNGVLWVDDKQVAVIHYEQIWAEYASATIIVTALKPQEWERPVPAQK